MKLQYDVSARIIRMPCTARLDINFILKVHTRQEIWVRRGESDSHENS
ncbi:MAG: hypothetical protein ACW985_10130 [Candidatus Thorarchaeota archaeon]